MYGTADHDIKDSVRDKNPDNQASERDISDSCIITFGSIVHIEVEDIPKLQAFIRTLPNARIIYSMKGLGNIRLVKD